VSNYQLSLFFVFTLLCSIYTSPAAAQLGKPGGASNSGGGSGVAHFRGDVGPRFGGQKLKTANWDVGAGIDVTLGASSIFFSTMMRYSSYTVTNDEFDLEVDVGYLSLEPTFKFHFGSGSPVYAVLGPTAALRVKPSPTTVAFGAFGGLGVTFPVFDGAELYLEGGLAYVADEEVTLDGFRNYPIRIGITSLNR